MTGRGALLKIDPATITAAVEEWIATGDGSHREMKKAIAAVDEARRCAMSRVGENDLGRRGRQRFLACQFEVVRPERPHLGRAADRRGRRRTDARRRRIRRTRTARPQAAGRTIPGMVK
jgi:hypothetical protein